jgi:hypothetical protein
MRTRMKVRNKNGYKYVKEIPNKNGLGSRWEIDIHRCDSNSYDTEEIAAKAADWFLVQQGDMPENGFFTFVGKRIK